jgi:hypothetical protein
VEGNRPELGGRERRGATVEKIKRLARRLGGGSPAVAVCDHWSGAGETADTEWPATGARPFRVTAPGDYLVRVRRVIAIATTTTPPALEAVLAKQVTLKGEITVKVNAPGFPTQIAGPWKGALMIATISLPSGIGPPSVEDEGCVAMFQKLQGKSLDTSFSLRPANFAAGTMTLTVTPPKELKGQAGEPTTREYLNGNGKFTAKGILPGGVLHMQGVFVPAAQGWTLKGAWQQTPSGKTRIRMNGTWSASNADAK